jgi:hypothetical protein
MKCQCPAAGVCPTHRRAHDPEEGRPMPEALWQACREREGMFDTIQADARRSYGEDVPRPALPPAKSRGLGDTLAKVFKATGVEAVAKAVEKVTGKPCGCAQRQEWLNEKFPAKGNPLEPPNSGLR